MPEKAGGFLTKEIGPKIFKLPMWAWGVVGGTGVFLYRRMSSGQQQTQEGVATDAAPESVGPYYSGGSGAGAGGGSGSGGGTGDGTGTGTGTGGGTGTGTGTGGGTTPVPPVTGNAPATAAQPPHPTGLLWAVTRGRGRKRGLRRRLGLAPLPPPGQHPTTTVAPTVATKPPTTTVRQYERPQRHTATGRLYAVTQGKGEKIGLHETTQRAPRRRRLRRRPHGTRV